MIHDILLYGGSITMGLLFSTIVILLQKLDGSTPHH